MRRMFLLTVFVSIVTGIASGQDAKTGTDPILAVGLIGAFSGVVVGEVVESTIWTSPVTTNGAVTGFTDVSPNGLMGNNWTVVGNMAIGAIVSIGFYELGHRVFKWW